MISIIIPVLNEEQNIGKLIRQLKEKETGNVIQIIVVDGGSSDNTVEKATGAGAVVVLSESRGRAIQMNTGAEFADGEIFYFLHADSIPPSAFDSRITDMVNLGYSAGCFRLQFDRAHFLLKIYAWFTRFDLNAFRFGDQSLFITKEAFHKIGRFSEDMQLLEGNDIIRRIKRKELFTIIPQNVVTSARKYEENGVLKLQLIFTLIYVLYQLGVSQEILTRLYDKLIKS